MVATGASGTTSVRYGTMRENVLSLIVVNAQGEIVKTRSRARKSSRRLRPDAPVRRLRGHARADHRGDAAPAAHARGDDRRDRARSRELANAVDCVIDVLANGIPVARIELLDDVQMDAINRHAGLDRRSRRRCSSSSTARAQEVEAQAADAGAIADEHGGQGLRLGGRRGRAPRRCGAPAIAPTTPRARCGPARTASPPTPACRSAGSPSASRRPRPTCEKSGLLAPIVGHVGDGNFHLAILVDPDDPEELARGEGAQRPPRPPRHRHGRDVHGRARRGLRQVSVP